MTSISVLIPYRSSGDEYRDRNFGIVWTQWMRFLGPNAEVLIGQNDEEIFNRSAARNDAFRRSKGNILIIADADTLFIPNVVASALGHIYMEEADWILPYMNYYNATESWSNWWATTPAKQLSEDDTPLVYEHCLPGATSGVIVLTREAYQKAHGYDERFIGWGWEDLAFSCTLSSLFHKPRRLPGFVVHLYHHRSHQENFGQPHEPENRKLYDRYVRAEHDPELMHKLLEEHSCV